MIYTFDKFEDFEEKAAELGITSDLKKLQTLDVLFFEQYPDYILFNLISFESGVNKILILTKNHTLIYPSLLLESNKFIKIGVRGPYGESTMAAYTVLKKMAENYRNHFESLNRELTRVADNPTNEKLEDLSKRLRRLSDIVDDFHALLIRLRGRSIPFIDTKKIGYDFDILLASIRHLSHRCNVARRDMSRTYTITEMKFSKELNKSIEKLTNVMLLLTAATLVITIPNTVATIFGIPAISEISAVGYIMNWIVVSTLLTILLAFIYFRREFSGSKNRK
ncbi:hypothetical protein DRN67_04205 [Candidatus Micrarchaeota archaeon]|nr:MAG: hypothetical protein DRN67_04205 [Candidatus Micrarchaeota archaeon]